MGGEASSSGTSPSASPALHSSLDHEDPALRFKLMTELRLSEGERGAGSHRSSSQTVTSAQWACSVWRHEAGPTAQGPPLSSSHSSRSHGSYVDHLHTVKMTDVLHHQACSQMLSSGVSTATASTFMTPPALHRVFQSLTVSRPQIRRSHCHLGNFGSSVSSLFTCLLQTSGCTQHPDAITDVTFSCSEPGPPSNISYLHPVADQLYASAPAAVLNLRS